MAPKWKIRCLQLAECADAWRMVPRILLLAYCVFVYQTTDLLLQWYMNLPAAERTLESGGFAAGLFTALTGFGTVFVNAYLKSGRHWNGKIED